MAETPLPMVRSLSLFNGKFDVSFIRSALSAVAFCIQNAPMC